MRLSQHSDYAFRMLIHAALKDPARITVAEVAQAYSLSSAHLQKVAQTLASHGYLQTIRGRSGGFAWRNRRTPSGWVKLRRSPNPIFRLRPACLQAMPIVRSMSLAFSAPP